MPRMRDRILHPEFFTDAKLYDAEQASGLPLRLAYAALWCAADREGRFEWKPRELKLLVMPYDAVDMLAILEALVEHGFITHYSAEGSECGWIRKFQKWQHVHPKEARSKLPEPPPLTIASPEPPVKSTELHVIPRNSPKLPVIPVVSTSTSTSDSTCSAPHGTGNGNGKHPAKASRSPPVGPPDWVDQAVELYAKHIGVLTHGMVGKTLKPLVAREGWETVKAVLECFCELAPYERYLTRMEAGTLRPNEEKVKELGYHTDLPTFVKRYTHWKSYLQVGA